MRKTIIFSGSGGQGIMSMGTMLAQAAVESGKHAVYMPSYGPEQRGGSAKCVVIIDDEGVPCPMAEYGDALVALSMLAYNKFLYELKPGGLLLYDNTVITEPISRTDITAIPVPADDLAIEIGAPRSANVIVAGVLIGLLGLVSEEEFSRSLERKFASKSQSVKDQNTKALRKGLELGEKYN